MSTELPIHLNGSNDQPTTCPMCGRRTEWEDITPMLQTHRCECGYRFFLEWDEDDLVEPGPFEPFLLRVGESSHEPTGNEIWVYLDHDDCLWYEEEPDRRMKAPVTAWKHYWDTWNEPEWLFRLVSRKE